MSKPAFKIGQSLFYRKSRMKESGRYVVLAVLPPTHGEVRYRIRSCDDESLEYIACEGELGTRLATIAIRDEYEASRRPP